MYHSFLVWGPWAWTLTLEVFPIKILTKINLLENMQVFGHSG